MNKYYIGYADDSYVKGEVFNSNQPYNDMLEDSGYPYYDGTYETKEEAEENQC